MKLRCPHCQHLIVFGGDRPRFCSNCGQSLSTASSPGGDALTVTLAPPTSESDVSSESAGPSWGRVYNEGDILAGYRLARRIGAGAMGCVFEAEHRATSRRVAVKLISPDISLSAAAVERFKLEGRLASMIAHPRCVFVMEADEVEGQPYIVMELMPGTTLSALVQQQGPLPPLDAVTKILDVIDGLREAHRIGVIHRDVKPSNCFLDAKGRVKIGDFGLAKSVQDEGELTRAGSFVGTVLYSSPEQIKRQPLDVQADVYSVCATLYFLLTGRAPFAGGDALAAATRIVSEDPPPLRSIRPDIPAALERVVLRGLERDKAKRWPDLDSLRAALSCLLPNHDSVPRLGFRFFAVLTDFVLLFIATQIAVQLLPISRRSDPEWMSAMQTWSIEAITGLLYFALFEGIRGWTPGKYLFRLRVHRADGVEPPGVRRALGRAAVFVVLLTWGSAAGPLLAGLVTAGGHALLQASDFGRDVLALMTELGLNILGAILLCITMRARNGYRGLHEFATGTRVTQLPKRRRPVSITREMFATPLDAAAEGPSRIGRFPILGTIRNATNFRLFLAHDPALSRRVWITMHPGSARSDEVRQRDILRLSRLRWVGGGSDDGWCWDAWMAPQGVPLTTMIRSRPLPWREAGPILENLAHELTLSVEEDTLPEQLRVQQVWVGDDGQIQLLSFPWSDRDSEHVEPPHAEPGRTDRPETRAIEFLRRVALHLLEGESRENGPARICSPLPRRVANALQRLFPGPNAWQGPKQFRDELRRLSIFPDEVSRWTRLLQIALVVGVTLPFSFCFLGLPSVLDLLKDVMKSQRLESALQDREFMATVDLATGLANTDPVGQLAAVARWHSEQSAIEEVRLQIADAKDLREIRLRTIPPILRRIIQIQESEKLEQARHARRWDDARSQPEAVVPDNDAVQRMVAALILAGLWGISTAIFRGGWSLRLMNVEVVGHDGQPIDRWKGFLRGALVWVPVLLLWCGSEILAAAYWGGWKDPDRRWSTLWMLRIANYLWRGGAALFFVYFVSAMWRPDRAPHDRILGTYLVPR